MSTVRVAALLLLSACAEPAPLTVSDKDDTAPDDTGVAEVDDTADTVESEPPGDDTEETGDTEDTEVPPEDTDDPPEEVVEEPPAIPLYSGGACPTLAWGPTSESAVNTGFLSSGVAREFRLLVPASYDGSQAMPVVFAWHWLNASSNSFVRDGELEAAAEQMGFIVVLPDDIQNAYLFDWPFAEIWGAEQELVFFDDLLACVDDQFNIDPAQVHGIGVSAGALWLTYLAQTERADHLATVTSLSGGLGDVFGIWRMEYAAQAHKYPAVVLNGGPNDWLGVDFHAASARFQEALLGDGHFVVTCEHDQGHAMPPIEPPQEGMTRFYSLWQFMLDHPYGTPAGTSPYQQDGLPSWFPEFCSVAQ